MKSVKIKMKNRILGPKSRQIASRDFANTMFWKLRNITGMNIDNIARSYCKYMNDLGIFLRWDGKKRRFSIQPHWRKYL